MKALGEIRVILNGMDGSVRQSWENWYNLVKKGYDDTPWYLRPGTAKRHLCVYAISAHPWCQYTCGSVLSLAKAGLAGRPASIYSLMPISLLLPGDPSVWTLSQQLSRGDPKQPAGAVDVHGRPGKPSAPGRVARLRPLWGNDKLVLTRVRQPSHFSDQARIVPGRPCTSGAPANISGSLRESCGDNVLSDGS